MAAVGVFANLLDSMKLIYAKLWLKKYIKYNHNELDENKLNRAIINLSHRVYKSHGRHGHNVRQNIRSQLVEYSKSELARYDVTFERPLQVRYMQRHARVPTRRISHAVGYTILWIIKLIGLLIIVLIIYYILLHL